MKHKKTVLADGVTLLSGVENECCIYLIEGKKSALLVDTGFGSFDIRDEIREITSLPCTVINTHGHGDHSGGNMYFEKVYMHRDAEVDARDALNLNKTVLPKETVEKIEQQLANGGSAIEYVSDGFEFDLGGKHVEVIEIPGHTPGCIALLDKEDRLLFSGDCAVKAMDILLVVPQALSLSTYLGSMERLTARSDEFDSLCTGHDEYLVPGDFLGKIVESCREIVSGAAVGEPLELPPVFGDTHALRLSGEGFAIAYRPLNIK